MKNYTAVSQFDKYKVLDYIDDGWGEQNLSMLKPDLGGCFSQVLLKLAYKRGDVFISMDIMTFAQLKELMKDPKNINIGLENIVALPNVLDSRRFYLLIAKSSQYIYLLPKIDEQLLLMRKDGTMRKIMDKYVK